MFFYAAAEIQKHMLAQKSHLLRLGAVFGVKLVQDAIIMIYLLFYLEISNEL